MYSPSGVSGEVFSGSDDDGAVRVFNGGGNIESRQDAEVMLLFHEENRCSIYYIYLLQTDMISVQVQYKKNERKRERKQQQNASLSKRVTPHQGESQKYKHGHSVH